MLHCHVPYCRRAGRWPFGEEWFYEAAAETYIPLLELLGRLQERGVPARLTVGLTPILLEQMADPYLKDGLEEYMALRAGAALADESRFNAAGQGPLACLARLYHHGYRQVLEAYRHRYGRDLVGAFRRLQEDGYLEILGGAATHGYLPLLAQPGSVRLQLEVGVRTYHKYFGRDPEGLWLPECAYRPGLEDWLARFGIRYFFVDSHAIEGGSPGEGYWVSALSREGEPPPAAAGLPWRAAHPEGAGFPRGAEHPARDDSPRETEGPPVGAPGSRRGTTFLPYYLDSPGTGPGPARAGAAVAVFGRNREASRQVWSRYSGYPGDGWYREYHKRYEHSGLQYWRVTGPRVGLGDKGVYDPGEAARRVEAHAEHFARLVEGLLDEFQRRERQQPRHSRPGIVVSAYDGELFGHWWYEGLSWLEQVLERMAFHPRVELTTPGAFIRSHPPREGISLGESSWGERGNHYTWKGPFTDWMWPLIHEAENRMRALAEGFPAATGVTRRALNQAARELLLLQSSDWGFLITTGQAGDYATRRFREHLERFDRLATVLERALERGSALPAPGPSTLDAGDVASPAEEEALVAGDSFAAYLQEIEEADNPFPDIDYRYVTDGDPHR